MEANFRGFENMGQDKGNANGAVFSFKHLKLILEAEVKF